MKSFAPLFVLSLLITLIGCSALGMTAPPENVLLKSLTVEGLTLTPAFDPAITEYTATTTFAWTAKIQAETLAKSVTLAGTGEQNLTGRVTDLVVAGTGAQGAVSKYHVKVTLTDLKDGDDLSTFLKTLTPTEATLVPNFDPKVTEYKLVLQNFTGYKSYKIASTPAWNSSKSTSGSFDVDHLSMGEIWITCTSAAGAKRVYKLKPVEGVILVFNANGGDQGSNPDALYTSDKGVTTIPPIPQGFGRTGYSFAAWNTRSDGAGKDYLPGDTYTMSGSAEYLYARWSINKYEITYDGNGNTGGTVPVDSTLHDYQSTVSALGNTGTLAKTGYAFGGWNTKADGTGTNYAAAGTFTVGAGAVTLFAKWTPVYSVTYDANGASSGTAPVDTTLYANGATVTVLGNTGSLAKTGFVFGGWNTAADGTGTNYAGAATFSHGPTATILFAKWNPVYSVTYNANGATSGTVPVDSALYASGASATILGNSGSLARTGKIFGGWNPNQDGSGAVVYPGTQRSMSNQNVVLYAQWGAPVAAVSTGGSTSYVLRTDGTLWVANPNFSGTRFILTMSGVAQVSAGSQHTMILKTDGTLWGSGSNAYGQLGDGTTINRSSPVQIASAVSSVSAGRTFTLFVKNDGTLWSVGDNTDGQLARGTMTTPFLTPAQVMTAVARVSAGTSSLILRSDSTAWASGANNYGQLGDGTTVRKYSALQILTGISTVSAGNGASFFLKQDGTLWVTGRNWHDLGGGNSSDQTTPIQIMTDVSSATAGTEYAFAVKTDNTMWRLGITSSQVLADVASASCGGSTILVARTDGSLWGFGDNSVGQLGDGTTTSSSTPVQIIF